jgi:Uma2 family endonuclease
MHESLTARKSREGISCIDSDFRLLFFWLLLETVGAGSARKGRDRMIQRNTLSSPPDAAQRFLLPGVGWRCYDMLLHALGERRIRLTYDRGDLELMAPSFQHEQAGKRLGQFVLILAEELAWEVLGGGSTTLRREELDRGLEPDECFFVRRSMADLTDPSTLDLNRDPPPNLAIEVDIASSSLDRQGIYAALGIAELWRYDGSSLSFLRLGQDGDYRRLDRSRLFPFLEPEAVLDIVQRGAALWDVAFARLVRSWIRERRSSWQPLLSDEAPPPRRSRKKRPS